MVVSRIAHIVLGIASGLAGFVCLPYLFLALHDVRDALGGELHGNPKWGIYGLVGFLAILCFGGFFMAYRFLRYASAPTQRIN